VKPRERGTSGFGVLGSVCGWEGKWRHKGQGSTTEPKSAPNGAARPCACQLPVNTCLQRSGVRGPRACRPSLPNQGGKTVRRVLGEGRLAPGEETARKGKDNYM